MIVAYVIVIVLVVTFLYRWIKYDQAVRRGEWVSRDAIDRGNDVESRLRWRREQ